MGLCAYADRFPALAEVLEEIKELVLQMTVPFLVKRTLVECESGFEHRATELRKLRPLETWGGVMWGVTLAGSLQAEGERDWGEGGFEPYLGCQLCADTHLKCDKSISQAAQIVKCAIQ